MKVINFSKTTLLLILLVIFIITSGISAYQWWQVKGELVKQIAENENLTKQVNKLEAEIDKLQKEIEELKTAKRETTNWKNYRNKEYGYEVKYPKDWDIDKEIVYVGPDYEYAGIRRIYKWGKTQILDTEIYDGTTFEILIARNPENLSPQEWMVRKVYKEQYAPEECNPTLQEEIKVDRFSAIKIFLECNFHYDPCPSETCYEISYIFIEANKKIYRLDLFAIGPEHKAYLSQLNQILSAFRIIDIE